LATDSFTIKKKNPLAKLEIPALAVNIFYFFLFYSMASGDIGLMISNLMSFENGIIGLTFVIAGFGITVILNWLRVSKICIDANHLMVANRLGMNKKYSIVDLEKCMIKWYDGKGRRFPFIQFNFKEETKVQIAGHHYRNLKPFILFLRSEAVGKLHETK
jgi:hypothetical protein